MLNTLNLCDDHKNKWPFKSVTKMFLNVWDTVAILKQRRLAILVQLFLHPYSRPPSALSTIYLIEIS